MSAQWTIRRDGVQFGPADDATVRTWIVEGRVLADDLVWTEGLAGWQRAGSVATLAVPPQRPSTNMALLMPVGRSGHAIAAGYLALFGLVIFPLAFVGLVFGLVALRQIKARPHLLGQGRAVFAVVVGSGWALVLAALFVAARVSR